MVIQILPLLVPQVGLVLSDTDAVSEAQSPPVPPPPPLVQAKLAVRSATEQPAASYTVKL